MISPMLEKAIILYICVEITYTIYCVVTDLIEEYYK